MKSERSILKLLPFLILTIASITPSPTYCQNNKSTGIPTWAELTFWGSFALVLGKVFIYDKYDNSSEEKNNTTVTDSAFNAIIYLLDGDQLNTYDSLYTSEQKLSYLETFWNTVEDEYIRDELRLEFKKRYAFADSAYDLPYKRGWKTDRGRIHILYGKPDERVIRPFVMDPFLKITNEKYADLEIWYYNSAAGRNEIPFYLSSYNTGQMFFVFYRRSGHAEYDQIFSTEAGEKTDPGLYGPLRTNNGTYFTN